MELMSLTSVLLVGVVSLLLFYIWRSMQTLRTFERLGIPGPRPLPLVGNTVTMMRQGTLNTLIEWGKQYGSVYGIYFPTTPSLVVSDLDMVREVMVKKFSHFANRVPEKMVDYKPWSDNLLQLRDDHWKHVRGQLSPTFSSGKLKKMMPVIQRVVRNLDQYVKQIADSGETVELKKMSGCFAMDSIAGAAFGMDVNSLLDPNDTFTKFCYDLLQQNMWLLPLLMMFPFLGPLLHHLFGLGIINSKATRHLLDVLDQALKDRRQDSKKSGDFLQLLVDAEKEGEEQGPVDTEIDHSDHLATSRHWTRKGLTEDEIKANALVFLLAGYDTTSTVMSFTLFMLAAHKDILQKAQAEIDNKVGQNAVTYDSANELTYLDMCINESIRLYPPGLFLDRETAEDMELGGYQVKKGMRILLPAWVIHMDSKYWPDPNKFDPERHTPEARATRHPFSFMPFGMGPRNCIGMRLAQLEMRMAIATLLQHYTPVLCDKSVYPPKINPPQLQMVAADGLWVKFTHRD